MQSFFVNHENVVLHLNTVGIKIFLASEKDNKDKRKWTKIYAKFFHDPW